MWLNCSIRIVSRLKGDQHRILYFAPAHATERAAAILAEACEGLSLSSQWELLPMPVTTKLSSPTLTALLTHVLNYVEERKGRTCTLVGSDTPDLPLDEILTGQCIASGHNTIKYEKDNREEGEKNYYICPAADGGYVSLTLPLPLPPTQIIYGDEGHPIFSSVQWSSPQTLSSQIAALEIYGLKTHTSAEVYSDIDEVEDLNILLERAHMYKSREEGEECKRHDESDTCQQGCIICGCYDTRAGDIASGLNNMSFRYSSPPVHTLQALSNVKNIADVAKK